MLSAEWRLASARRTWLLPVLSRLLPHVYQRLTAGWEPLLATSGRTGAQLAAAMGRVTSEDSSAANEEVVQERLLRELTGEHLVFLRCMQDAAGGAASPPNPGPNPGPSAPPLSAALRCQTPQVADATEPI